MSSGVALIVMFACLAMGVVFGLALAGTIDNWWKLKEAIDHRRWKRVIPTARLMSEEEFAKADLPAEPPKEFPIAGKPRRVRWAVKRREIEAKHRTKRERLEEWG